MKISKKERDYLWKSKYSDIPRKEFDRLIEAENGYLKELTSKIRKKRNLKNKDRMKNFGKEFSKMVNRKK